MTNMITLSPSALLAPPSLPAPAAAPEAVSQTVGEFLQSGGPVMVPLAICSIVTLAFTLERAIALRRRRICPAAVAGAVTAVQEGRVAEAEAAVESLDAPAARILRSGLRRNGFALADVESAFEDQGHKEVERLQRNVRPLGLIAAVAPLLGLLGTVLGIAEAFRRVSQAGMGKPEMLAGGIEEALTTTIAGLCVAIPSMLLAAWLHARIRKHMAAVDEVIAPAVEPLARRPVEESHAA